MMDLGRPREFARLMKTSETAREILPPMLERMRDSFISVASARHRDLLFATFEEFIRRVHEHTELLVEEISVGFAQTYTAEELEHMIAMYDSPIGQSIAAKGAEQQRAMSEAGERWASAITAMIKRRLAGLLGA